jgi:hypothetical protein
MTWRKVPAVCTDAAVAAFDAVKQALCSAPVLALPHWSLQIIVTANGIRVATCAVLSQVNLVNHITLCVHLGWLIPSKMVTGPTCYQPLTLRSLPAHDQSHHLPLLSKDMLLRMARVQLHNGLWGNFVIFMAM